MEYLKVMLVDDEDLVIEDIQALIDWEAHGFRVVGFAYNGRQAQRLVEEVQGFLCPGSCRSGCRRWSL